MVGRILGGLLLMVAAVGAYGGGVSKCRGPDGRLFFTDKGCFGGQHESWNDDAGYGTVEGTAPVARSSSAPRRSTSAPQQKASSPSPPASSGPRHNSYVQKARDATPR